MGKGTQAVRVAGRFGVPHVSTGDLLRAALASRTEIGLTAKKFMEAGELVPDSVVLDLIRGRLGEPDAAGGFILDGFPRNAAQAESLGVLLEEIGGAVEAVVALEASDEALIARLSGRFSCPACNRVYNVHSNPPRRSGVCDEDSSELLQRSDDAEDVVRNRLRVYREQTEPLIAYYDARGLLARVAGAGEVGEITLRIERAVEEVRDRGSDAAAP